MKGIANASEPMDGDYVDRKVICPDHADFAENVLSNVLGRLTVKQSWMGSE